jgi:hypothetical protein
MSSSPRSSSPRTRTYTKQRKTGFVSKGEKHGDNQYLSFHRAMREVKPKIPGTHIEENAPESKPFTNWKEATNYKSESSSSLSNVKPVAKDSDENHVTKDSKSDKKSKLQEDLKKNLELDNELKKLEEVDAQIQRHDIVSKDVIQEHSKTLKQFNKKVKGIDTEMEIKYKAINQNYKAFKHNHIEYWKLSVTPGGKTRKSKSTKK